MKSQRFASKVLLLSFPILSSVACNGLYPERTNAPTIGQATTTGGDASSESQPTPQAQATSVSSDASDRPPEGLPSVVGAQGIGNGVRLTKIGATLVYDGSWELRLTDEATYAEYSQPINDKMFQPAPKAITGASTNRTPCGFTQVPGFPEQGVNGKVRNLTDSANKCEYDIEVRDVSMSRTAKGTPTKEETVGKATVRFRTLVTSGGSRFRDPFRPMWFSGKLENVPIVFMPK